MFRRSFIPRSCRGIFCSTLTQLCKKNTLFTSASAADSGLGASNSNIHTSANSLSQDQVNVDANFMDHNQQVPRLSQNQTLLIEAPWDQRIRRLVAERDQLKVERDQLKAERDRLTSRLQAQQGEIGAEGPVLKDQSAQESMLKDGLVASNAVVERGRIVDLQQEIDALKQQLKEKDDKIAELNDEIADLNEKIVRLQENNFILRRAVQRIQTENFNFRGAMKTLRGSVQTLRSSVNTLQADDLYLKADNLYLKGAVQTLQAQNLNLTKVVQTVQDQLNRQNLLIFFGQKVVGLRERFQLEYVDLFPNAVEYYNDEEDDKKKVIWDSVPVFTKSNLWQPKIVSALRYVLENDVKLPGSKNKTVGEIRAIGVALAQITSERNNEMCRRNREDPKPADIDLFISEQDPICAEVLRRLSKIDFN